MIQLNSLVRFAERILHENPIAPNTYIKFHLTDCRVNDDDSNKNMHHTRLAELVALRYMENDRHELQKGDCARYTNEDCFEILVSQCPCCADNKCIVAITTSVGLLTSGIHI